MTEHYHLETLTHRLRSRTVYETHEAAEQQQQFVESALGPCFRVVACAEPQCRALDAAEQAAIDAAWEATR